MSEIPHILRMMQDTDIPAVCDSWHKSYHSNPLVAWVPPGPYVTILREYIYKSLIQRTFEVLVACPLDAPDEILGWVAADAASRALHYVYVKQLFRDVGLGKSLLMAGSEKTLDETIDVTFWPKFEHPRLHLRFRPWLFYTESATEWMKQRWNRNRIKSKSSRSSRQSSSTAKKEAGGRLALRTQEATPLPQTTTGSQSVASTALLPSSRPTTSRA